MRTFIDYVRSDLIQAKILRETDVLSLCGFTYLFMKFRTCRVSTFVRMRSYNYISALIAGFYLNKRFIQIGRRSIIGKYFFLPHPWCVIIADNVIIGEHVHIGQYCTIGGSYKKVRTSYDGNLQKVPVIGNNVMISPGVVIGGPVNIGDECLVGANTVVTKDVPSNKIVSGQNQISKRNIRVPSSGGELTFK